MKTKGFFFGKLKLNDLAPLKQRDDDIDAFRLQRLNLIVEPIAAAQSRHDAETSGGDAIDPIDIDACLDYGSVTYV